MKILFISNIPSPYRLDFFNELGKVVDLKVVFEAERNYQLNEKWYSDKFYNFNVVFLKHGAIEEKKTNFKILKLLDKKKQDLIVVTNYCYFTELFALLYIKLKKIPYCMEIDGGILKRENKFMKAFKSLLIKNAKAYISPSNSTDEFLIYYGAKKEKIYRYPFTSVKENDLITKVLTRNEKIEIKNKLGIKQEKVIISVGQFIHRKGNDVLLKACKNIDKNIGIYIVGGDPTVEYLELKKSLKLDNVHFVGFKTKEELSEYYMIADLFVLPTREDIWGLVINEAMAYGLPVITTDKCVAGMELIKNNKNGFIVPVDDDKQLAEKMNAILSDDKLREKMAQRSLDKIKEYTIENMTNKHVKIFQSIINKK